MTELTERLTSALADRYRIERELGAGGMATVYLAEDLKHDRKVALKVLKPELAAVLGGDRFLQEIKTTAALQHPHILPLFDSGTADGFLFYVMPFIDGETLRDRLNRERQLGVEEAVKLATDVADALDYAHRNGVIHRDIKPENILLHDGRPVVADFGIALAVSAAAGGRMTETGLSLGTPHYMSPEQATAERELTNRSDIYSLGCVLYEMLTGDPPHTGSTAQQIIMKIVTDTARPVVELRRSVPAHVAAAVAKALEKLPADRFGSAADFAAALEGRLATTAVSHGTFAAGGAGPWRSIAMAATAVAVLAVAATVWALGRTPEEPVVRLTIAFPEGERLVSAGTHPLAIAPDGSRIVYVGPDSVGTQLWLRELSDLHARPLPGTEGAQAPFFSPDGLSIGFFTGNPGDLRILPIAGGPTVTVVPDSAVPFGGHWASDGNVYFALATSQIGRVPATGGAPEVLSRLDSAAGHTEHDWPQLLPGGKTVLLQIWRSSAADAQLGVLDLRTGDVRVLFEGVFGRYVETGHIVYGTFAGALVAVPFDVERSEVTGAPLTIADGLQVETFAGTVQFDVASNGTLLYVPGGGTGTEQVVWVERDGTATPVDSSWFGSFGPPALSPDGSQLAVSLMGTDGEHIAVKQLPAGPLTRLTFGAGTHERPVWLPDGRHLAYVGGTGRRRLWVQRADGSARPDSLLEHPKAVEEVEWVPNTDTFLVRLGGSSGVRDIYRITDGADPEPLVTGPFDEFSPAVSPDGRWFAYVTNESGRNEVYVRSLEDPAAGRTQVSVNGGDEPLWSNSGRELFFRANRVEVLAAPVTIGETFTVGRPQVLFRAPDLLIDNLHRAYDITPDDRRFIMVDQSLAESGNPVIVFNWFTELRDRAQRP